MKKLFTILVSVFLLYGFALNAQPVNDNYAFATVVTHATGWCSADAAYTTVGATSDLNAASCWNTSPNYNVWFRFQATSQFVNITVDRGGPKGNLRGINLALWESDGTTELACNRYVSTNDDVAVGYTNLTVGNWYYISVDNYFSGYRGSFTLCIDDQVDYDYYEGAIVVPHTTAWCSPDAEYTTVGATPDHSAASCWNTSPNYNRWFTFQATSAFINITVDRGGAQGTLRGANLALWESDGTTEVTCNRYVGTNDDVAVGYTNLTVGNWYYISVDNYYSGYRGTFTLCIDDQVDYDYYEGAIVVPHTTEWCSPDAEYTTVGATPDLNAASCWNTSPNYNRWFTFQATSAFINITVDRGGAQGTLRGANLAIWESDGTTEVACNRYVSTTDDVVVGFTNLTVGNWYYIAVDNYYSGYRGTFTLCIDDQVDYDYYEGALVVPHTTAWCSPDAEYTTVGATPDRNAASCWNTSPNYNRWFTFQATSAFINITVDRGGAQGTLRGANLAIWESDGTTEVACNRYVSTTDDVVVGFTNLTVGNWYYISVDNYYSGYRGTFTLCIDDQVDYDYYEGAIVVPHTTAWCSANAEYTTVGATPDRNAASCWNTSPNYNRWFTFQATSAFINITVDRGGAQGTLRGINLAIWESDGTTEVACNRYVGTNDDVTVGYTNLTVGNWYYISVDNYYSGYRGSFTLCIDDQVDYDYYEGAIVVPHTTAWCSANAEYTTVGATPDRNAASCWNTSPNYNRWFTFQATSAFINITVDRGGAQGTLRGANLALWESDGTTEVACNRYVSTTDDVVVGFTNLTVGNWYYISVDNYYSGYRGSFTLCIDDVVDYDYYEGAIELSDITNWCSPNAIYTTVGATPDRNAATCWNTSPNYNRWFKFQASNTEKITFTILRGGFYGTIRGVNVALWEADGVTQVACNRYVGTNDNVSIQQAGLTDGDWYYISVDNYYSGYRGSFSLCIDDGRVRWNGSVDNDWANAGNWNGGFIPSALDDIVLESGLPNYPEVNSGADANVKSLLLESGTQLTVPTGKALTVVNNIDLEADASGFASLIDNGTLNYDNTKTSCQSYLSEDQWHLVSSPVSSAQSGVFYNIYLKYFTESDSTWNYITSLNYNLTPGTGYASWAASWITEDTTIAYHGAFNTGDLSLTGLTYNTGLGFGDGWNLVGNPFPSAVEWNTNWTTNDITESIYVYDGNSGQYLNWNRLTALGTMPNGDIPPGQGFWIKADGSSPSMTIPHSERKHTSQAFYKGSESNILRLLASGNDYSDQLIVHFNNNATKDFDGEFDAYKLMGIADAPQIYALTTEDDLLAMNVVPTENNTTINVGFKVGVSGTYQVTAKELASFNESTEIYLEDLTTGEMINLLESPIYEFYSTPGDDELRFNLHFIFKDGSISFKDSEKSIPVIYAVDDEVMVQLPEFIEGDIVIFDMMGQLITEQKGHANSLNSIKMNVKSGIYIVKVVNSNEVYSEKVFIK